MPEKLKFSLKNIEFMRKELSETNQSIARVSFEIEASIIEVSIVTFVLPWNGKLADLHKSIASKVAELSKVLASYKVPDQ